MSNCKKANKNPKILTPDIEANASEVIEEEITEKIEDDKKAK
ncbi:hypothetical protein [uncultured Cetobacterium sp.]|nr:hypothetical protein [uncultured Cetobacterium sp.]